MNKMNMPLLILAIFSITTLTALASDMDANISTNETIANPMSTTDSIEISETAKVINITENSSETTIIESTIEQKKSSPGFGLTESSIALIIEVILIMVIVDLRKNRKIRR